MFSEGLGVRFVPPARVLFAGLTALVLAALTSWSLSPATSAGAAERPRDVTQIQIRPTAGPAGTTIRVRGEGFRAGICYGNLYFTDAAGTTTWLGFFSTAEASFHTTTRIPGNAQFRAGTVLAQQRLFDPQHGCVGGHPGPSGSTTYTVTP
jgi:hypothetical protein